MMTVTPHFDLPFRFVNGGAAEAEQDSTKDIMNCVEAVMSTHVGTRVDVPAFGVPELAFRLLSGKPASIESIRARVAEQEPRAELLATESPDYLDNLISHIRVEVEAKGGRDV